MEPADAEALAELLRGLANPQRLMIMASLLAGERAVSELEVELGIRQPSLSQHLGSLRESGFIGGRRQAKAVFYRIGDRRAAAMVEALYAILRPEKRRTPGPVSGPTVRTVACPGPDHAARPSLSEAAMFAQVDGLG